MFLMNNLRCSICDGACTLLDVVDFNKTCGAEKGHIFPLSGVPVYYGVCGGCGFCFAPELAAWTAEEFGQRIYNHEYALIDPDYSDARPRSNAAMVNSMFGQQASSIKHLDYGGGAGLLADLLRQVNWSSVSYDPFVNKGTRPEQLGKFDLITAFEVFEHVPDAMALIANLRELLVPNGIVLFSTLVSDGNIHANQRLSWWYAAPRNGHISLFSKKSLNILAQRNEFKLGSFSDNLHVLCQTVPAWAQHILK